jgi:hypothetical protein
MGTSSFNGDNGYKLSSCLFHLFASILLMLPVRGAWYDKKISVTYLSYGYGGLTSLPHCSIWYEGIFITTILPFRFHLIINIYDGWIKKYYSFPVSNINKFFFEVYWRIRKES